MTLTNFKIESLGYEIFEGFTKAENWNGWACPYFTFDQAQKVLKQYNQLREIIAEKNLAFYDENADAFVFPANGENESEIFVAVTENDRRYYPVGAFCWIWEEEISVFSDR